uniref:Protein kinase C-terminal domain-containing protein n=1 Tax=Monopterus albus TaxID=43700 RepID=A0A3Q3Q297_MONAL
MYCRSFFPVNLVPSNCLFNSVQIDSLSSFLYFVFCLFFFFFSLWQKSRRDVANFDKEFTKMVVELTPTDKLFIMNLDQNEFQGFSYTNPEFIIQV